jgi:hypothetical protein
MRTGANNDMQNMVKNYRPTDATTAKNNVVANAGVGKVN